MKKIVAYVVIVIAFLASVIFMGKDLIAKTLLVNLLNKPGGARMSVGTVNVGILRSYVGIKNLELLNPDGYSERLMANFPEIYMDYDPGALFKKKLHIEEARLHLESVTVVRNKERLVNVDSLAVAGDIKENSKPEGKAKPDLNGFHIDSLKLKIGKVIWKDYSSGEPPIINEYDVNIDEEFKDISNPYTFAALLIAKTFAKTPMDMLAEFNLDTLKAKASQAMEGYGDAARKAAQETVEKTRNALKKILPITR